jgi:hypothetical protein
MILQYLGTIDFEQYLHMYGFISRVARWHIFKPKSLILVNFGVYSNGRC